MRYLEAIRRFNTYLDDLENGITTKAEAKRIVRSEYRDAVKEISPDKVDSLYSECMATLFDIEAA